MYSIMYIVIFKLDKEKQTLLFTIDRTSIKIKSGTFNRDKDKKTKWYILMCKLFVKKKWKKSFLTFNTYKCTFQVYKNDLFIKLIKMFPLRLNEHVFKMHLNVFYLICYTIDLYLCIYMSQYNVIRVIH